MARYFCTSAGMYVVRPANVFPEHCLNGLNDVAFGPSIPWVREFLEVKGSSLSLRSSSGDSPTAGDLMVMNCCQLDSMLVWFAFLGFVAIPPLIR